MPSFPTNEAGTGRILGRAGEWLAETFAPALIDGKAPVRKGELLFNVRDYGAKGDGTTDDGPAIQAAINAAMAHGATNTVSGSTANKPAVVFLPSGVYYVKTGVAKDLTPVAGSNIDKQRLTMRGAGPASSFILYDATSAAVGMEFWNGHLTMEDLTFDGKALYGGVMLSLGRHTGSHYVNQFSFNRVHMGRVGAGGRAILAEWMFDGTFTDCLYLNIKEGGVFHDFPAQTADNSNNIVFTRCHWEMGVGATFVRTRSNLSTSNYHTGFTFDGCHMETRSFNTRFLDVQGASRWTFINLHAPQSNSPTGEQNGIVASQIVNAMRFVDSNNILFLNGGFTRQGTPTDWARKYLSIGGTVRGLRFVGGYFFLNTASGMSTAGKSDIWESDSVTPRNAGGMTPLSVEGTTINNFTRNELFNEVLGWADTTSTNAWTSRFDPTTKKLVYGYGSVGNDIETNRTDRLSLGKDGGLNVDYLSSNTQVSVAAGATYTFSKAFDGNPNKRGVFIVQASVPGGGAAMVYNSGSSLDVMYAGSLWSVGTADPAADAKFNLFLTGANLTITNRTTSARTVSIVPIVFSA